MSSSKVHLPQLPISQDLETKTVLRKLVSAHRALAELKGVAATIPNQEILINTLALQEAKDSSEIESIITTHDELYQNDLQENFSSGAAKEVSNYTKALRYGFEEVKKRSIVSTNDIIETQEILEGNSAGFRTTPGTNLVNDQTGEVIYTPPQHPDDIIALMRELELLMNDETIAQWDPLVKMAVIHHQFESIHPFYDGNGRTGRILNILYLVKEGLLDLPILYLSRYINQHKATYYELLQTVRQDELDNLWEAWILYILEGIEQTSVQTLRLIREIQVLMSEIEEQIRREKPKIYSQDLLNNIFKHPYTKIDFVIQDLEVSRPTATRYLKSLVDIGVLESYKFGRSSYYINRSLFELLVNIPPLEQSTVA